MSDPLAYKGRIFGRSVLEAAFRSFYGSDLFLGELLAAEDPDRARRFLFRVIQVTYGSDSADPGWAERTAGAYMSGDVAGSPYTLHDPEQRIYKVATCQPLGYIDAAGAFRKPKSLPAQFARVTAPTPQDFAFLRERMGDLTIGLLRSGEDTIDLEVGIRGDTITSHVGVFATTGMGKSNLMKVLAGQILASRGRYACLLFDPHGEYLEGGGGLRRGLRHHPWAADRLKVYATRAAGAGATALRLALSEITQGDLQTAYQWSHAQEDAIWRLVRYYGEDWIVTVGEEQDVPALAEQLSVATSTLQVIQRRAQRILEMPCISRDLSQPSLSERIVQELTDGYSVLVDTSGLSWMEEIARRVGDHAPAARDVRPALSVRARPVRAAAADARRARGGPAGARPRAAQRRERVPPAGARRPEVQGRSVRRVAAAEADRRRAALAVQHVLHPRAGR